MNPLKFISKNWRLTVYIACFSLAANSSMADKAHSSISVFDWTIAETLLSLDLELLYRWVMFMLFIMDWR